MNPRLWLGFETPWIPLWRPHTKTPKDPLPIPLCQVPHDTLREWPDRSEADQAVLVVGRSDGDNGWGCQISRDGVEFVPIWQTNEVHLDDIFQLRCVVVVAYWRSPGGQWPYSINNSWHLVEGPVALNTESSNATWLKVRTYQHTTVTSLLNSI